MILRLSIYFILMDFYIFAFAGWIYESIFVSVRTGKVVNRGFLVGPILPLYGFGAVTVYVLLRPFSGCASLLYVMGMLIATVLEYITSWLLEVLFHAKWWDYSEASYNLNGRIALIPSMFWGILSLFMFDVLQPAASFVIKQIPQRYGEVLLVILMVITAIDLASTVITTINFRKQLENLYEFKRDLENALEEIELPSLRELFGNMTKELSERMAQGSLGTLKETLSQRFENWKGSEEESDSKLAMVEERFRHYLENRSSFLKKRPFTGNRRIVDAFPTMKILPKNHAAIDVKELLMNVKQKWEEREENK